MIDGCLLVCHCGAFSCTFAANADRYPCLSLDESSKALGTSLCIPAKAVKCNCLQGSPENRASWHKKYKTQKSPRQREEVFHCRKELHSRRLARYVKGHESRREHDRTNSNATVIQFHGRRVKKPCRFFVSFVVRAAAAAILT